MSAPEEGRGVELERASTSLSSLKTEALSSIPSPKEDHFVALAAHTKWQVHGVVWQLAWPAVATMLLQTFNSLMDTLFVGHLPYGAQALAATGVGGQVIFLLICFAMGVSVGATALVARFIGSQDADQAAQAAGQSLGQGLVLGIVFGMLFYFTRISWAHLLLGSSSDAFAVKLCVQFLSIALLATPCLFLLNALMGVFRGLGDTRTPMYIQVGMICVHMSLDWLLIYGHWGFPRLGIYGAGTAFASSLTVGTMLYLMALGGPRGFREAYRVRHLLPQRIWWVRLLRIGVPASINAVIRQLGMMSFTGMLARAASGSAGVAALNIGVRAEAIAFMPGVGYSVAAQALVGQSLGARDPDRAERFGYAATWQGVGVMTVMAALFFLCARPFAALFTGDRAVIAFGSDYLRVNALSEPFLALAMVLTGGLQGAGDTVRPTVITLFTMWIVRLPLAWWLIFGMGLQTHGAWLSMATSTILTGILVWALFRGGSWKRIQV